MKSFQQKRGWQNLMRSKPVLLFLGAMLVAFAWSVFGFTGKMEVTRKNREFVEQKAAELEEEKARLASDIARLETEQGLEESIRERFGMGKEGEGLIIIVEDKNELKVPDEPKKSFFAPLFFWKNWFK